MKHFFFQITPQIDFQIHPVAVTATSEIISEPITTPQDVSKPIVKTTPPKDKKKVSFNQQQITPKMMSPKVIELPEVAASTVISIENQNLLDQGKPNPSFPINYIFTYAFLTMTNFSNLYSSVLRPLMEQIFFK